MSSTQSKRKSMPLLAVTLVTGLCVFTVATAEADESIFGNLNLFRSVQLEDLRDGDLMMSGSERAGLHLSMKSQSQAARYNSQHARNNVADSGVHMSWKIAW